MRGRQSVWMQRPIGKRSTQRKPPTQSAGTVRTLRPRSLCLPTTRPGDEPTLASCDKAILQQLTARLVLFRRIGRIKVPTSRKGGGEKWGTAATRRTPDPSFEGIGEGGYGTLKWSV